MTKRNSDIPPRLPSPPSDLIPKTSEASFQSWVIDVARIYGWLVMHSRPAMKKDGSYSTAITGDKGWPDISLCHPTRGEFIVAELKSDIGKVSAEQQVWIDALHKAGVRVDVWRPRNSDHVLRILSGADQ